MKANFKRLALPAAISLALAEPTLAAQYSVQVLNTASNTSGASSVPYVYGLNGNGKAVGTRSFTASNPISSGNSAVLYDHGLVQDLVPLAPNLSPGSARNFHLAHAINDADQVVGSYTPADPNYYSTPYQAFLYENGALTNLGGLGGLYSTAYGINNRGQIVGGSERPDRVTHAVLYDVDANGSRTITDLAATSGSLFSAAYDINSQGQIVGHAQFGFGGCYGSSNTKAFIYNNGTMTNLGTLASGCTSLAKAINDKGQVVGWSYTSGLYVDHGFFYENGHMTDLGTLGGAFSQTYDINNGGRAVGWAATNDSAQHAFLYADRRMVDLNNLLAANSGWVLNTATGINDKDQIVGEGKLNGVQAIYLLTPTYPVANAGGDVTVKENDAVTLDGSGSTAPGCTTVTGAPCPIYTWKQVGGPAVSLNRTDPAMPTFTAPVLPSGKKSDVLTFELVVKDDLFASSPATVNITVQHVNVPPLADAGQPRTLNEGSPVTLDGSASYDPDGVVTDSNYLTYSWTNPATTAPCSTIVLSGDSTATPSFTAPSVGAAGMSCAFELVVTDVDGAVSPKSTTSVTIENVNHPPLADAGTDQTVNEGETPVTLNGSASSDPDGDALSFSWTQLSGTPVTLSGATTAAPSFTAPLVGPANDTLTFQLAVDDGLGGNHTAPVNVTVLDKSAPPACDRAKAKLDDFWPPNHKMRKVKIEGLGEDKERVASGAKQTDRDHDDVFVKILGVTQDEPTSGLDGSDASPDAAVMPDDGHDKLLIRAERAEGGNGRVYQIRYGATDKAGQYCEGTVKACVPKAKAKKAICVDDGQQYDSYLN